MQDYWFNFIAVVMSTIAAITSLIIVIQSRRDKMKADLFLTVLSYNGGIIGAAIKNKGQADATNIKLTFPNNPKLKTNISLEDLERVIINPGEQFNISFSCPYGYTLPYNIEWSDKRIKRNKRLRTAQLLRINS